MILREQILIVKNTKDRDYIYGDSENLGDRMFESSSIRLDQLLLMDTVFFLVSQLTPGIRTILKKHSYFNPELRGVYPFRLIEMIMHGIGD
jgi:hypothetical protein